MLLGSGNDSSSGDCVSAEKISQVVGDPLVTAATIVSCSLSIAGSLLIIATFLIWKDIRRSSARWILVWLAVADLLGAASYLGAGIRDVVRSWNNETIDNFTDIPCEIQAFATTYFPVVSFFWTAYLAVYFVVNLVLRKHSWGFALQLVFHLSAWCIPLVVLTFAAAYGLLGNGSGSGTGGWCWVTDSFIVYSSKSNHSHSVTKYFMIELVTGKLWEILSYFVVALCYFLIVIVNRCEIRKYSQTLQQEKSNAKFPINTEQGADLTDSLYKKQKLVEALARVDRKLLLIPIVFVFLRIWGTIRFFISLDSNCHVFPPNGTEVTGLCINKQCFNLLYNPVLVGLQAFCDPFQGFSNCILFIFCSKVIVVRLLGPCVFPVSRFLKRTWRNTKLQEEEEQTLITNDEETCESGSKMVPKRQTPQMIRVFYKPRTSSSRSDRTSDYTTDEDVPSNPSRHISYGSVDQRLSNGTQSL